MAEDPVCGKCNRDDLELDLGCQCLWEAMAEGERLATEVDVLRREVEVLEEDRRLLAAALERERDQVSAEAKRLREARSEVGRLRRMLKSHDREQEAPLG